MIYFGFAQCSLGKVLVATTDVGLCAVSLAEDISVLSLDLSQQFPNSPIVHATAEVADSLAQIIALIETPNCIVNLKLDLHGTVFQQRVWQTLLTIPCGSTATYSEIAQLIQSPKATRAVASACAANPLSVIVPCHRVIRKNGQLSGYRWGIERKAELLRREKFVTLSKNS
jgi:AraC family transcriptional regulator of adaptative response/methylated-DNA-[protein]-cysteine methyltransferase